MSVIHRPDPKLGDIKTNTLDTQSPTFSILYPFTIFPTTPTPSPPVPFFIRLLLRLHSQGLVVVSVSTPLLGCREIRDVSTGEVDIGSHPFRQNRVPRNLRRGWVAGKGRGGEVVVEGGGLCVFVRVCGVVVEGVFLVPTSGGPSSPGGRSGKGTVCPRSVGFRERGRSGEAPVGRDRQSVEVPLLDPSTCGQDPLLRRPFTSEGSKVPRKTVAT